MMAAKKKKKIRPPRAAAIVITIPQELATKGETYGRILAEAKDKIDLSGLGVDALRFRVAQTGGRILEIPGKDGAEKADWLAGELQKTLAETEVVVTRPVKCMELRITGLDDSVTQAEIAAAVTQQGGCTSGHSIRVNIIRRTPQGMGTTWVKCPLAAANKLATVGRLKVGRTSARVQLLKQRPLQCYRCLIKGYTGQQCTAEVDRSDLCYRCGEPGHKAATCSAKPNCPVCRNQGDRQTEHRCGSPVCKATNSHGRGGGKGVQTYAPKAKFGEANPPTNSEKVPPAGEAMEVAAE